MRCTYRKHWREYLPFIDKYWFCIDKDKVRFTEYSEEPGGFVKFYLNYDCRFTLQGIESLKGMNSRRKRIRSWISSNICNLLGLGGSR